MVYKALAKRYGWTVQQIADMTPFQQLQMLSETEIEGPTVSFQTYDDYKKWLAERG